MCLVDLFGFALVLCAVWVCLRLRGLVVALWYCLRQIVAFSVILWFGLCWAVAVLFGLVHWLWCVVDVCVGFISLYCVVGV